MVVKKKPYFFIHLYSTLMKDYKAYEKNFNNLSLTHFGLPIKALLRKESHTDNELSLIRKYRKYSPVLETDCVMNSLCKEIENIEFDIKYRPNATSMLPMFANLADIKEEKVQELMKIYKEYKAQKKFKGIEAMIENEGIQDEDVNEILKTVLYAHKDECRDKMLDMFDTIYDLFNHLVFMCQESGLSCDCIWDIIGEEIIDIIPDGKSQVIVDDKNGFEYLGHKYQLREVSVC